MLRYVHTLSALLFYLLAGAFFLAYMLMRNDVLSEAMSAFLVIGQLPLLTCGLLYGGLSVYRSLQSDGKVSMPLIVLIAAPLALLFLLALYIRLV